MDSSGRWVTFDTPPYAPQGIYCHACGAMIPRRYWSVDGAEGRTYCGAACEALVRRIESLRARFPQAMRPTTRHDP